MQVLIERSNVGSDVRCEVCGQGFIVYWDWASRQARVAARTLVTGALREQHEDVTTGHHVHPEERFAIPERRSVARISRMSAQVDLRERVAA